MTDQKEKLRKLYVLALQGIDGEKEQAAAILEKLLKKYSMTLDNLNAVLTLMTALPMAIIKSLPQLIEAAGYLIAGIIRRRDKGF